MQDKMVAAHTYENVPQRQQGLVHALDNIDQSIENLQMQVTKISERLQPVLLTRDVPDEAVANAAALDASTVTHRAEGMTGRLDAIARQVQNLHDCLDL